MKSVTQRFSLGLCALVLVLFLAACGGTGANGSNFSTPTPTPTPPPPTPTPTPAVVMKTYTGTTFSISYPLSITETAATNEVTFADPVSKNIMTIITLPNPGGTLTANALGSQTMSEFNKTLLKNGQTATITPTATVGGDTWLQLSSHGELVLTDPGVQGTLVALFDAHPASGANSQIYEIVYYGPTTTFAQANTQVFQPMLKSFKFIG